MTRLMFKYLGIEFVSDMLVENLEEGRFTVRLDVKENKTDDIKRIISNIFCGSKELGTAFSLRNKVKTMKDRIIIKDIEGSLVADSFKAYLYKIIDNRDYLECSFKCSEYISANGFFIEPNS